MKEIKQNSLRAWLLAARPKTLTAALTPVLVGTALALADGCFRAWPVLLCLLFACGMQVAANFINDLYDYRKGTDREDRLGPERACAQGWITPKAMLRGICVTTLLSCAVGCGLLYTGRNELLWGGWELVMLGGACVLFAILYTTLLSYYGWGDLLVVLCFGLIPVGGVYYVQAYTLTTDALVAGLACGLAGDALLVINNYRDREQDRLSGKLTLVVRLGEPFGRYLYLGLGIAATLLSCRLGRGGDLYLLLLPCFYLLTHVRTWRRMCAIRSGKTLNSILGETSRNMLFMGILLSAMLIAQSGR